MPYFLHPCERSFHFEAAAVFTAGAFILPGHYVISAGDVGIPLRTDYTRMSGAWEHRGVPKASSDTASRSLREPWLHT